MPELMDNFARKRCRLWDHAAEDGGFDFRRAGELFDPGFGSAGKPKGGWEVGLPGHTPCIRLTQVGVRVTDVEQENHGPRIRQPTTDPAQRARRT